MCGMQSVSAWEVWDGTELAGRFYLDMHPREGKDKWFCAHPLIPGIRGAATAGGRADLQFSRAEGKAIRG